MNLRVLITAGASGIGREIARALAANGVKVFVSDIDANGLDAVSSEIDIPVPYPRCAADL
jgi:NAD(P)-dependent dehydrogenase (short-subunit alcohol dehydrogenase family)